MPSRRSRHISASPQASPPASTTAECLLPRSQPVRLDERELLPGVLGCCCHWPARGIRTRLRCAIPASYALRDSAGLEEHDRGEDAAVVIVGLVQVQLGEDAADVFLHSALGDEEPPRD